MTFYKWSQVANNDATADSTINWAEGQAPSSINDSARAMMAASAKYRDDISGAIVTTGTSTAYLVSSYQAFDTLAHLSGQMIAFTPHVTNAGTACTLNVDSLTAKPLRSAPNVELSAGTIIQGTPYLALYNNADGAFYLHGIYGNPYSIPIGGSIEYWLSTAPNSSFAFPFGQAISRTTYATLFTGMGTTHGAGDGSTTFNLPDVRGRVTACPDQLPGSGDANRLTGGNMSGRLAVGGSGGEATHALIGGEIPTLTSTVTTSGTLTGSTTGNVVVGQITDFLAAGGNAIVKPNGFTTAPVSVSGSMTGSATTAGTGGAGGGVASGHNVIQPTILCNKIIRII
jgi:microcystin-dependent protein